MGHVFNAFGSAVTVVQRGPRLLMAEDEEISARFTDIAGQRFRVSSMPASSLSSPGNRVWR